MTLKETIAKALDDACKHNPRKQVYHLHISLPGDEPKAFVTYEGEDVEINFQYKGILVWKSHWRAAREEILNRICELASV